MTSLESIKKFYKNQSVSYEDKVKRYWNFDRTQITDLLKDSKNIVEFGVGTGLNIPFYPSSAHVTAIDLSEEMVVKARLKAGVAQPVRFLVGDVSDQNISVDTFDGALATYYFSVTSNPNKDLETLKEILQNGSTAIIVDHAQHSPNFSQWLIGSLLYRIFYFNPYRDLERMFLYHGFRINKKVYLGRLGRKLQHDTYLFVLENQKI